MEIDEFLEKSITSFLDSKMAGDTKQNIDREEDYGLYLTKDYMKELTAALENDELSKAKRLFDELKDIYNKLPKNSLERKSVYAVLQQMYASIEQYTNSRENLNSRESNAVGSNDLEHPKWTNAGASMNTAASKGSMSNASSIEKLKNVKGTDNLIGSNQQMVDHMKSDLFANDVFSGSKTPTPTDNPFFTDKKNDQVTPPSVLISSQYPITLKLGNENRIDDKSSLITPSTKPSSITSSITPSITPSIASSITPSTVKSMSKDAGIMKVAQEISTQEIPKQGMLKTRINAKQDVLKKDIPKKDVQAEKKVIARNQAVNNVLQKEPENGVNSDNSVSKTISKNKYELEVNNVKKAEDVRHENADFYTYKERPSNDIRPQKRELPNNKLMSKESVNAREIDKSNDAMSNISKDVNDSNQILNAFAPNQNTFMADVGMPESPDEQPEINYKISKQPEIKLMTHVDVGTDVSKKKVRELYEAGIYNMFQNNYVEASKIFEKITELRPKNRAARIRLLECREVMENA